MTTTKELRKGFKEANKAFYDEISKHVIGHDYAKKVLINTLNKIKLRAMQKAEGVPKDERVGQLNCLLVGDSGTGKTHLIESLVKVTDVPLLKLDATTLNPTGASGGIKMHDLERMIKRAADEHRYRHFSLIPPIDTVVVFVDEVDKLSQKLSSDWNEHVQASFLKLFENGNEFENITFIFAGAFTGLDKYPEKEVKKSIGFTVHGGVPEESEERELSDKIIEYGLLPEFVGRMNHLVLLEQLKEKDYMKILRSSILSNIKRNIEVFGIDDFKLSRKQEEEIVRSAMKSGLGVRHMKSAVSHLLVEYEFNPTLYGKKK